MAVNYKNIVITPNRSSNTADPKVVYSGGNTTANTDITLNVYPDSNGTLSWEGSAGQLFSITNDLSNNLFGVNDVSGIPSLEVYANGLVSIAPISGNVGVRNTAPSHTMSINGNLFVNTDITIGNSSVNGIVNSTTFFTGNVTTGTGGLQANTTRIFVGNNTINAAVNTTTLSIGGTLIANSTGPYGKTEGSLNVNSATQATNATNLNSQPGSFYTNATNITTGTLPYAQIPANIINTTAAFTISGIHTYNANIVLGSSGLSANGSFGTAGQVLHSNGTATYWSVDDNAGGTVTSVSGTGTVSGLTLSGTVTTTGSLTLGGTLSASVIDNMTDEHRLFNNMGDNHATRTAFDASSPSYNFGWRFVQGNTNGPGVNGATQYYSEYVGLGNDYLATGAGSYGMHIAYPRNVTTPYIAIRYVENNALGAWQKISAGFADTANNASFLGGTAAASYQLNSTLNANIASYLPTYSGVVNGSSHTVGTSFTANSTVVNAVSYYAGTTLIGNTTGPYGKTEGSLNVNNATTAYGKTEGNLNVNSAVTLATARNIGDVSFNGSAAIVPERITFKDTRGTNYNPFSYAGITLHLKTNTTDSLTDGGTYHGVLDLQHWSDSSGGVNHQLGLTDNGNMYIRYSTGASSWSSWNIFQLNSTLSANVATLTANNASFLGGTAAASYALLASPTFTGTVTVSGTANVSGNVTIGNSTFANTFLNSSTGISNPQSLTAGVLQTNASLNTLLVGPYTVSSGNSLIVTSGSRLVII